MSVISSQPKTPVEPLVQKWRTVETKFWGESMADECLKITEHPSTILELVDLVGVSRIDCTEVRHVEDVSISNCPALEKISFCDGEYFRSATRSVFFDERPKKSVSIDGLVGAIGCRAYGEHRSDKPWIGADVGPHFLKFNVGDGALYTSSLQDVNNAAQKGGVENLLFIPTNDCEKHIKFGKVGSCTFTHIGVMGPAPIKSIHIDSSDVGLQVVTLRDLPHLEKVKITGHVRLLEIDGCTRITDLDVSGDHLNVTNYPDYQAMNYHSRVSRLVKSNGIWMDVDGVHLSDLTVFGEQDLRTGEDLQNVLLRPFDYECGCQWSHLLNMELCDVMDGVSVPLMIERLKQAGPLSLNHLEDWFVRLPYLSQQYYALRVITALAFDPQFDKHDIWMARDNVLASNRLFESARPQTITCSDEKLDTGFQDWFLRHVSPKERRKKSFARILQDKIMSRGKTRLGLPDMGQSQWYIPENGKIPFQRLDTEIWVQTGGVSLENGSISAKELFRYIPMKEIVVSIEMLQCERDTKAQQARQEEMIDDLFERLAQTQVAHFFDMLAACILEADVKLQHRLAPKFLAALEESNLGIVPIIAISAAMLQIIDTPGLRITLSKARSSPAITAAEAKTLHALAMSGSRAFESGLVPPIRYPIIGNWRNLHE